MGGEYTSRLILESEFDEDGADVSPNGRWIAYVTDESDQDEIYVRPYPNIDDGKWQVSRGGGQDEFWGPDGTELFYRRGNALMVLSIEDEEGSPIGRRARPESPSDRLWPKADIQTALERGIAASILPPPSVLQRALTCI